MKSGSLIEETIANDIVRQASSFREYLRQFVIGNRGIEFLDRIARHTSVYIFSGVIRDFLIGECGGVRDLDIVVGDTMKPNIIRLFNKHNFGRNSFGGLKFKFDRLDVDVWQITETWGIKNRNLKANINNLLNSAFFNFSAIVFDYNNTKFIFDHNFINFLSTKQIDIVLRQNPNIPLCLFNIYYYQKKYNLELSTGIKEWIHSHYNLLFDFNIIQEKHLGRIEYSNDEIRNFLLDVH